MNWFPGTSIEYELAQVKLGIKLYKKWVHRTQKIIKKLNKA